MAVNTDVGGSGPILGLYPANERRRYKVTASLIGWAQTWTHPCGCCLDSQRCLAAMVLVISRIGTVSTQYPL